MTDESWKNENNLKTLRAQIHNEKNIPNSGHKKAGKEYLPENWKDANKKSVKPNIDLQQKIQLCFP